jgi:hypothetical protein
MMRLSLVVVLIALALCFAVCQLAPAWIPEPDGNDEPLHATAADPQSVQREVGASGSGRPAADRVAPPARPPLPDPLVIPDCRLVPVAIQDVPSRREGQLLFIGTQLEPGTPRPRANELFTEQVPFLGIEVVPGEVVPESQFVTVPVEGRVKRYRPLKEDDALEPARLWVGTVTRQLRRLHENDPVKKGQLLASLDASLAIDDLAIKYAKLVASQADWQATQATRAAAVQRLRTARGLYQQRAISREELNTTELEVIRYRFEEDNKRQAVKLTQRELNQARTILGMHEIHSKVDGVIRSILKKPGEAVKNLEPVFQVHNPRRLRVEGMAAVEHLPCLQALKEKGQRLVVEPARLIPPRDELSGHLLEVTSVAVSNDSAHPLVVSGSEDGTVRVWDPTTRRERWIFRHGAPVRAVTVLRTLYSRSTVRLDWYDSLAGTLFVEISYAPAGQADTIRAFNDRFGLHYPLDMPVDVPALLLSLEAITVPALQAHMARRWDEPDKLRFYLYCLAILSDPDIAAPLRPYAGHPAPLVRGTVIDLAAQRAPDLLRQMRGSETGPDLRARIEAALSG